MRYSATLCRLSDSLMSRRTKRGKIPKGYDSWLEYDLSNNQLKGCEIHPGTIDYVQHRTYEIDFLKREGRKIIYIESKGRFRDRQESKKYTDIVKCLGKNQELVFVFADSRKPMPGSKRRKDGTRLSHGEFAEKNGIRYYDLHNIPKEWSRK